MFFVNHFVRIAAVLVALIGLVSCSAFFSQSKTEPTKPSDRKVVENSFKNGIIDVISSYFYFLRRY